MKVTHTTVTQASSDPITHDLKAVADAVRANDRFVVVTHENPDGDALGSMIGIALALRSLGKDVVTYLSGTAPMPGEYRFLDLAEIRRELPDDLRSEERRVGKE